MGFSAKRSDALHLWHPTRRGKALAKQRPRPRKAAARAPLAMKLNRWKIGSKTAGCAPHPREGSWQNAKCPGMHCLHAQKWGYTPVFCFMADGDGSCPDISCYNYADQVPSSVAMRYAPDYSAFPLAPSTRALWSRSSTYAVMCPKLPQRCLCMDLQGSRFALSFPLAQKARGLACRLAGASLAPPRC